MKPSFIVSVAALAVSALSLAAQDNQKLSLPGATPPALGAAAAPGVPVTTAAAAAAPAPVYTETQILESVGWFIGRQAQIDTFAFTPEQLVSVNKGFGLAAADKDSPYPLEKIGPQIDDFVAKKQAAWIARLKAKGEAESAAFFTALKAKPGVTMLPSGLGYEILKPGTGPMPKPSETVTAHYVGTLINGEVFDSSREAQQPGAPVTPASFVLDQVIPGWTEGLQKIGKGGTIKLYVPAKLAYGDEGRGGIPPASTLIFEIEILDIKPTPGPASIGSGAAPFGGK